MKPWSRLMAIALAVTLVATVSGCSKKDVAGTVNGEVIKKSEVEEQIAQIKKQYPQMFTGADGEARIADFRKRIIDNMVTEILVRQAAKDAGIKVSDKEVDAQVTELKRGFPNEKAFLAQIQKAGMTLEGLRDQVRDQLITQKLLKNLTSKVKVSEADISKYYETNKTQFKEDAAIHARHILFKQSDKATAQRVLGQIRGGADFAALARQYSQDTATKSRGGDLGWPTTPFVAEFQAAADRLQLGQVSDLVLTPFGWHIIKIIEKRPARQQTLAQVKERIKSILLQEKQAEVYQKFINALKKKAKIQLAK
ncbi:MAG: peptidylprolyl isomerase [Coriobacteriia bacterium]